MRKCEYFTPAELACSCCGKLPPDTPEWDAQLELADKLRGECGFPLTVTSGYRCASHPIEAAKDCPGMHTYGAMDFRVRGRYAHILLKKAMCLGFTGIGVQQKGHVRFIHLDLREEPTVWSY